MSAYMQSVVPYQLTGGYFQHSKQKLMFFEYILEFTNISKPNKAPPPPPPPVNGNNLNKCPRYYKDKYGTIR